MVNNLFSFPPRSGGLENNDSSSMDSPQVTVIDA